MAQVEPDYEPNPFTWPWTWNDHESFPVPLVAIRHALKGHPALPEIEQAALQDLTDGQVITVELAAPSMG